MAVETVLHECTGATCGIEEVAPSRHFGLARRADNDLESLIKVIKERQDCREDGSPCTCVSCSTRSCPCCDRICDAISWRGQITGMIPLLGCCIGLVFQHSMNENFQRMREVLEWYIE